MEMKIAAFFIVWGDEGLLTHAIRNIAPVVDKVFVVYSRYSNFGEIDTQLDFVDDAEYLHFEPDQAKKPAENERAKRNFGLDQLRERGFTHFIMLDGDEFYEQEAFKRELTRFSDPNLKGLVCPLKCYFRTPYLSVKDHTLVTFIHKLTPELRFERNPGYPFAIHEERLSIDPTRTLNIRDGVEWSDIIMHHYSYIRPDVRKKVRNSTARRNLEVSSIFEDYKNAKEGGYNNFYQSEYTKEKNIFRLPEIIDESI
jgi:hypothetical protein